MHAADKGHLVRIKYKEEVIVLVPVVSRVIGVRVPRDSGGRPRRSGGGWWFCVARLNHPDVMLGVPASDQDAV